MQFGSNAKTRIEGQKCFTTKDAKSTKGSEDKRNVGGKP